MTNALFDAFWCVILGFAGIGIAVTIVGGALLYEFCRRTIK